MRDGSSVGFLSTDEVAVAESAVSECGRFMEEEDDVVDFVFCWCFWLSSVVQGPGVCVCFVMFVYGCVWQFVEHTGGVVFWNECGRISASVRENKK